MKKAIGLLMIWLCAWSLIGCSALSNGNASIQIVGHIRIDQDALQVDEVEIITLDDKDRMRELNLNPHELPNGYFIREIDSEPKVYSLTDQTLYNFTDVMLLFIDEKEADGNRRYSTTKKEEFMEYLYSNFGGEPPAQRVPFFIEVLDGKVISITEQFIYTQ